MPLSDWFPRDGRYPKHAFCDLAEVWASGDRAETISLDRLARLCGLPDKPGLGKDFAALWAMNRPAALAYLANDLRLTAGLWHRLVGASTERKG